MKNSQRRNQNFSGKWKAIIIAFSIIGAILLGGGLIYFFTKKSHKPNQQVNNLGQQQNQQTQSAVLQLASNILDNAVLIN